MKLLLLLLNVFIEVILSDLIRRNEYVQVKRNQKIKQQCTSSDQCISNYCVSILHMEECASSEKNDELCYCSFDNTGLKFKNKDRDAIVVTTAYVDDCLAQRLKHLVESSSSPKRDVWVLTSHHIFDRRFQSNVYSRFFDSPHMLLLEDHHINSNDPKLLRSRLHISNIPLLHSANQSPIIDSRFEGTQSPSRSSKSSFLKFSSQHGYRSTWLLEDDVFFTGDWNILFDATDNIDADVLTALHKNEGEEWISHAKNRLNRCYINNNEGKQKCMDLSSTKSGWFTIRLSDQFSSSLLRDINSNNTSGFHEDVTGAYSLVNNFTIQVIPWTLIGYARMGHKRENVAVPESQSSRLSVHSPLPNKLYHPVKCSAYQPGEMNDILTEWTNAKVSSSIFSKVVDETLSLRRIIPFNK